MPGRRTRLAAAVLAGLAGTVGLAGCGGATSDRTIELDARFSKFSPAQFEAEPGTTVKIVVHNLDPIGHELIIGDAGVHELHEKGTEPYHPPRPGEVSVPAGETRATTFTFPADAPPGQVVEFGCHLPGHWAYGMRGTASIV
jgi:uncharacterized cupredoxin-like copper-binding protein